MDTIKHQLFSTPPSSLDNLLEQVSPEIYDRLKAAIELGKWDDGSRLSPEQLENCMQLLILYEARELPENERTGKKLEKCDDMTVPLTIQSNLTEDQS